MVAKKKGKSPSKAKAKKMLEEGVVHWKKITPKQKRYFGWVAGGKKKPKGKKKK